MVDTIITDLPLFLSPRPYLMFSTLILEVQDNIKHNVRTRFHHSSLFSFGTPRSLTESHKRISSTLHNAYML